MAEALDILFDLCRFFETSSGFEDEEGTKSRSRNLERFNLALLAFGKATDLAADWVIVWQVFKLTHGSSGCTNTCEFARNFVCQDGQNITRAAEAQSCI